MLLLFQVMIDLHLCIFYTFENLQYGVKYEIRIKMLYEMIKHVNSHVNSGSAPTDITWSLYRVFHNICRP